MSEKKRENKISVSNKLKLYEGDAAIILKGDGTISVKLPDSADDYNPTFSQVLAVGIALKLGDGDFVDKTIDEALEYINKSNEMDESDG